MSSDTLSTEVICSVVFGTIASVLAVVAVIQNCIRKRAKGMVDRALPVDDSILNFLDTQNTTPSSTCHGMDMLGLV
ncbi:hypothetical protein CGRA01v4_09302 [Colletotrichum graminicola]|nr:hypothetical protein CGRA01v4_09302 [Colletotrichum graminicola]